MGWGIAGSSPLADLSKPVEELVRDLLFSQWGISTPAKGTSAEQPGDPAKVKFGLGWYGGVKSIHEIHCLHNSTLSSPQSIGWKYRKYQPAIDIHVFVRRVGTSEPATLFAMQNEIERIIGQNPNALSTNGPVQLTQWFKADDPDKVGEISYFHRVAQVEGLYWKVNTG